MTCGIDHTAGVTALIGLIFSFTIPCNGLFPHSYCNGAFNTFFVNRSFLKPLKTAKTGFLTELS